MSLIEEALRRKVEEQGAPGPEAGMVPPGASDTAGRTSVRSASARRQKPWLEVLGAVAVGLLLCGLAGWLLYVGLAQARKTGRMSLSSASNPAQAEPVASSLPPSESGTAVATTKTPEEQAPAAPVAEPARATEQAASSGEAARPGTTVEVAAQAETPPVAAETHLALGAAPVTTPPVTPAPVVELAPLPSPPEPVLWPRLAVSGILQLPGGECSARINGNLLMAGDVVEGATVVEVTRRQVVMVYQGETNALRVGDATR